MANNKGLGSTHNTNKRAEHGKDLKRQIQQKRESSKLDFSGPTSEGVTLTELKCGFSCSCSKDFTVLWGRRGEKRALSICRFSIKFVHYQRHETVSSLLASVSFQNDGFSCPVPLCFLSFEVQVQTLETGKSPVLKCLRGSE